MKDLGLDIKSIELENNFERYKDQVKHYRMKLIAIKNQLCNNSHSTKEYRSYVLDLQSILQITIWLINNYQQCYYGSVKVIYHIRLYEMAFITDFIINIFNYQSQLEEKPNEQFFLMNINDAIGTIERNILSIEKSLAYKEDISTHLPDFRNLIIKSAPTQSVLLNKESVKVLFNIIRKKVYQSIDTYKEQAHILFYQLESLYAQIINAYDKELYQVDIYLMLVFDYEQLQLYALYNAFDEEELDEESTYYIQKSRNIILEKIDNHIQLYNEVLCQRSTC